MNGGTDGGLSRWVSSYFENCDREIPNRRRSDITRRFDMGYLNNVHHEQTLATIDPDTQASEVLRLERFSWDFAKAAEESRQGIDHYARLYANAFEPAEILPQGCITPSSLVCMVSVVEFRGSWKQAFDDRTATRETFYESDGSFTPVVMVHQTGRFRFAKCTDLRATAIELPYELPGKRQGAEPSRTSVSTPTSGIVTPACNRSADAFVGPEFSLVVLLPEEKNGLELLESKLSAFTAMTCFDHLRAQKEVRVSLPLFKVKQRTPSCGDQRQARSG
ncbi:serpin B3-like isoform X2 [Dermacentor andersoni]|uniref:serpin B3-like isoform X2 n=1 Tax=Dermacentor andersoni TaxID=34620 RepID=UPI0024172979|nr:ovalbumin-like isoform X2 [Dermacentor andersoni]